MFQRLFGHLRSKLFLSFMVVLLVPTLALLIYNLTVVRERSIDIATESELNTVQSQADLIEESLIQVKQDILFMTRSPEIQTYASFASGGSEQLISGTLPDIRLLFTSFSESAALYDQLRVLNTNGLELVRIDLEGGQAISLPNDQLQDQSQTDYFQATIAIPEGQVYISPPSLSRELGQLETPLKPIVYFATPIYAPADGTLQGVIVFNLLVDEVLKFAVSDDPNESVAVVDNTDGTYLAYPESSLLFGRDLNTAVSFFTENPDEADNILGKTGGLAGQGDNEGIFFTHVRIQSEELGPTVDWSVVHETDIATITEIADDNLQATLIIAAISMLLALLMAVFVTRTVVKPITALSQSAAALSRHEWDAPIPRIGTGDEIGQLAHSMRNMAQEIRNVYATQEARITSRTRELEAVVEVSSRIASILDTQRLLQDVVDLTKERFGLYHAHIYLIQANNLVLTAGSGYVGELMVAEKRTIELSNRISIVASAARALRGLTVNDVYKTPNFLPHPLLPNTRAEVAIPLIARGELVGVLDVQSDQTDFFTDEFYATLEVLANQIATAIHNAKLFSEMDRARRHDHVLGSITRSIETAAGVEEILQTTVRELGKALRVPYTAIELQLNTTGTQEED